MSVYSFILLNFQNNNRKLIQSKPFGSSNSYEKYNRNNFDCDRNAVSCDDMWPIVTAAGYHCSSINFKTGIYVSKPIIALLFP